MKGGKIQAAIINTMKHEWKMGKKIFKLETPSVNGAPDIQALSKGRSIYIEVKGDNDEIREDQKLLHKDWRDDGQEVYIAESIEDGIWLILDFLCRRITH